MDGTVRRSNVKYTWELISQFVCWEFCRNANFEGDISDVISQTDLLQFFRDMVIKMTTKQYESDITPHEIAAKFIEELSVMASSSNPQGRLPYVVKLSESLKRLCPELKSAVTDLLSAIYSKLYSLGENGPSTLMEDETLRENIKIFSVEVFKHLPVPELIKATSSWNKPAGKAAKPSVTKEAVISRLKKEKLTRNEIEKIKSYIEADSLLKMYFDEVSYTGPGLEDFPDDDVTGDDDNHAASDRSAQRKTASSKNTAKASSARTLEDYFATETREVSETPVKILRSRDGGSDTSMAVLNRMSRSNKEMHPCVSDSDEEPEVVEERLSSGENSQHG